MDVVCVTLPHKHAVKGMKLVIINLDIVEGEKRWTSLWEELFSFFSRAMGFVESVASDLNQFAFAAAWLHEHSHFYSCHLLTYIA